MARPRTRSDTEIVESVAVYLADREWPAASWSLAEVSPAAGLGPAGLVKRFGSRAGLLRALGEHWLATIPQGQQTGDPLRELRDFARAAFGVPSAAAAVGGLRDLFTDLAGDDTAAVLREGNTKQLRYVSALLGAVGLSRLGESEGAARVLLDALHGGLLRRASGDGQSPVSPDETIDYFLEYWA